MSDSVCLVIGLAIVGVVAIALGVPAIFFGRRFHVKGAGLEAQTTEPDANLDVATGRSAVQLPEPPQRSSKSKKKRKAPKKPQRQR